MTQDSTGGPIDNLDDELTPEDLRNVVGRWAASEPLIRRVYLFGSRARGEQRPDSDVDLAILHDPDPAALAQSDGFAAARELTWSGNGAAWRSALDARVPVAVHIQALTRAETQIRGRLKEGRVCLYRRMRKPEKPAGG